MKHEAEEVASNSEKAEVEIELLDDTVIMELLLNIRDCVAP